MRAAFHEQLDEIGEVLAEMAIAVGGAMNKATQALLNADLNLAEAVISSDDHIDELTGEVERRCYDAAALQQPVATDLRIVVGALRISSSLERMGDLAVHVAKQARLRYPNHSIPSELRAMFAEMGSLADVITAKTASVITTKDIALGPDIERYDNEMDRLHRELFTTVLSPSWSHGVEAAIDATLLSRYYERYADHAVSIARRVIHITTGEPYAETSLTEAPSGS
jgi:phosphate transport system protein